MPKFRYVAMDAQGAETEGVVDADNQSQAISRIRSQSLFPTRVTPLAGGQKKGGRGKSSSRAKGDKKGGLGVGIKMPGIFKARVRPKQLMVFTRQLATLIDAGLPLLRGLRILLKQEKNPSLREAITEMGESVEGGSTFSESLGQHPRIFDKLFVNMVKAGEAGGVLEVVLARLAEFMEKAEKIKNKVKSAMIYPIVVLIAAVGILVFLLVNVIPRFAEIFDELLGDEPLPALTRFVIGVSDVVARRWFVVLIVVGAVFVALKLLRKTDAGSLFLDKLKLKLPVFGTLVSKTAIARLSRTLGTLLNSGVPVLQALNIVRDTSGNDVVARAIQHVHDSVKEGESMAMPMGSAGVFPDIVVSMVDVGEETGALPDMLLRVADNYDDEVDNAVEGLTSVIEPIMIIMLAIIIGTIVIAMFVPLISIITNMSQ
ncbi:MAG: type II secretion system F family protein [Kiritimatiellae bacterium]|nr:type II secretion system F family protein [Kiritimatiellia bacterium]